MTNHLDEHLSFWQNVVQLKYDGMLKLGGGIYQHRFRANGSVIKVNHCRATIVDGARAGYRTLLIASDDILSPRYLNDPDGNAVILVPRRHLGIEDIGVELHGKKLEPSRVFLKHILMCKKDSGDNYRCGSSFIFLRENNECFPSHVWQGLGYRYVTVRVHDVEEEHARALERGASEIQPPTVMGMRAKISFIGDPYGNAFELSQRADLAMQKST